MTSERDPQISALLLEAIPAPDASAHKDWSAVLDRAEATARRTPHTRVIWFARAGVGMAAIAALVFAAILFWPTTGQSRILDRALAAIGDGQIIHVTYRVKQDYAFVDLRTGRRTLVFAQHEEWLDPSGALRSAYRDSAGHLHITVHAPGKNALSGHQTQTYSGILNGYRKALENGSATLSTKTRFRGRDIYWVRFKGQKMDNVSNHKVRSQVWALEVAIDAMTYRPVYLYETIDGRPQAVTGQEIVSVETLPSGSVDFTPTPKRDDMIGVLGGSLQNPTDLTDELDSDAPAKALGAAPIWLGRNHRGQKLSFLRAGKVTWGFAPRSVRPRDMKLHHTPAIELCYGSTAVEKMPLGYGETRDVVNCSYRGSHVLLRETLEPVPDFGWAVGPNINTIPIPKGSLLVFLGGGRGLMIENGVYISIDAESEAAAIAAARALIPLRGDE